MKTCVIYGDLSSDSAGEQYPTVPVCDDCVAAQQAREDESALVSVGEYDDSFGDTCEFCGVSAEEEAD
jgi:hypothetical protein